MSRSWASISEKRAYAGHSGQWSVVAALVVILLAGASGGCRSKAYRDVYAQKMAGEIRVLEDQLYEADYQNQILRDELTRAQIKASQVVVPDARPRRSLFGRSLDDSGRLQDSRSRESRSPSDQSMPDESASDPSPLLDPPDNATPSAPTLPAPALPAPTLPRPRYPRPRYPLDRCQIIDCLTADCPAICLCRRKKRHRPEPLT